MNSTFQIPEELLAGNRVVVQRRYGSPDGLSFRNQVLIDLSTDDFLRYRQLWAAQSKKPTEVDDDLVPFSSRAGEWAAFATWLRSKNVTVAPGPSCTFGVDHPPADHKIHRAAADRNEREAEEGRFVTTDESI